MHVRNARWPVVAALALGTAACEMILGDVPEGRPMGDEDAGIDAAPPPDTATPPLAAEICPVPNARILDIAFDATDIYWIRAAATDDQVFAVEACSKNGGAVRPIAVPKGKPDALTLSENHVFWSINQNAVKAGGIWRAEKTGELTPTEPFIKLEHAGPLSIANGAVISAHTTAIFARSVERGDGDWKVAEPASAITVSASDIYWTRRDTGAIRTVPAQNDVQVPKEWVDRLPSPPPSIIAFDNGSLYWANVTTARATIATTCPNCLLKEIVMQPTGFEAFAIRNGNLYWTANEEGTGVLRGCTDVAQCEQNEPPLWSSESTKVSRIAIDDHDVYIAAQRGDDAFIVKRAR